MKLETKFEVIYGIIRLIGIVIIGFASNWLTALGVLLLVAGTQLAIMRGVANGITAVMGKFAENLARRERP